MINFPRYRSLLLRLIIGLAFLASLACNAVAHVGLSTPEPSTAVAESTATCDNLCVAPVVTSNTGGQPTEQATQPPLPAPAGTPDFKSPNLPAMPTVDSVIIYQEGFDPAPSNWNTGNTDNQFMTVQTQIANGGYQWIMTAKQDSVNEEFSVPRVSLPDGAYLYGASVQIADSSADVGYGLLFRVQDGSNFYFFEVIRDASGAGSYDVLALVDNKWSILIPKTPTQDLHPAAQGSDMLSVSAHGRAYQFFINNKPQKSLTDSRFSGGNIGLGVEMLQAGDKATLIFDNLKVCSASCDLSTVQSSGAPLTTQQPALNPPAPVLPATAQPVSSGDLLYTGTFDGPSANWNVGTNDDQYMTSNTQIVNGGYLWDLTAKQGSVNEEFAEPPIPLPSGAFHYSVTVQVVHGPSGMGYGLMFREQDHNNFYYFEVMQDGNYDVLALVNEKWVTLVPKTATNDLLANGNDKLEVIGNGGSYQFLINEKQQTTLADSRFSGGNIGLVAELFNPGETASLIFDNLTVCGTTC